MQKGIFVISGKPGAGKSTCCKEAVDKRASWAGDKPVTHLSIGNRVRAILGGEIRSLFYNDLKMQKEKIVGMRMIDNGLVSAIVEEGIADSDDDQIILLDGFPTSTPQIPLLKKLSSSQNASVRGGVSIQISDAVSIERQLKRGNADGHPDYGYDLAVSRLSDYALHTEAARREIAQQWGEVIVDGENCQDVVFQSLVSSLMNLSTE